MTLSELHDAFEAALRRIVDDKAPLTIDAGDKALPLPLRTTIEAGDVYGISPGYTAIQELYRPIRARHEFDIEFTKKPDGSYGP